MELIGLYLVGAALLVAAGASKAVRPDGTARALALLLPAGLAVLRSAVRVLAVGECVLGAAAIAFPRPATAWAVAASYAAFTVFVLVARRMGGPLATCGCFGTPDTPPTLVHVALDAALAASAAVVAVSGPSGTLSAVLSQQPDGGVPLLLATTMCAWLAGSALTRLPALQAARRLTAVTFPKGR